MKEMRSEEERAAARRRSAEREAEALDNPLDNPRDGRRDDPSGPPEAADDSSLGAVGKAMVVVGLAGVGFMALVSAFPMRTAGATATARLEWRRRRRVVAEAARLAEVERAKKATARDEAAADKGHSHGPTEAAHDE